MKSQLYKTWAPECTFPGCTNLVDFHKKYSKQDGTPGFKWKSACRYHRTNGKMEFNKWKTAIGCENADAHYGFECPSKNAVLTSTMIDINHKDGNRHNNDPDNLERLCRCCHGEVTIRKRHHLNRYDNTPKSTFNNVFEFV